LILLVTVAFQCSERFVQCRYAVDGNDKDCPPAGIFPGESWRERVDQTGFLCWQHNACPGCEAGGDAGRGGSPNLQKREVFCGNSARHAVRCHSNPRRCTDRTLEPTTLEIWGTRTLISWQVAFLLLAGVATKKNSGCFAINCAKDRVTPSSITFPIFLLLVVSSPGLLLSLCILNNGGLHKANKESRKWISCNKAEPKIKMIDARLEIWLVFQGTVSTCRTTTRCTIV
jgi:hypothetical protein